MATLHIRLSAITKKLNCGFQFSLKHLQRSARTYAFSAIEVSNRRVASGTFQHDADLFFSGKLVAGDVFNFSDESLRLFGPSFSLLYFLLLSHCIMYHIIMRSVSATNRPADIMYQIIRSIGKNTQRLRQRVSSYIGSIRYKGYTGYAGMHNKRYIGIMRYIDIICYIRLYMYIC